jgi:hypothetical protein
MTKDDVIRWAREAGIGWGEGIGGMPEFLEAFAKLVAEHERDACIAIAEKKRHAPNFTLTSIPPQNGTAVDIANAIRARSGYTK